ncbi:MAG: hypothetical protein ACRYGK_01220 [Janthinobacterium lividum]
MNKFTQEVLEVVPEELVEEWLVAEPVNTRTDMVTAQIVEHGIEIAKLNGIMAATAYLHEKQIDASVVERVLWRPSQRRKYAFQR